MRETFALAHDTNELVLLMSSSWSAPASKKWRGNARKSIYGPILCSLHYDDGFALAHGEHSRLPDETAGWAHVAFVSTMARQRRARIGPRYK